MTSPMRRLALVVTVTVVLFAGCSSAGDDSGGQSPGTTTEQIGSPRTYGVGRTVETFVDPSRPTPASGDDPGTDSRTLTTTIWYPSTGSTDAGVVADAPAATADGPYPLLVFSHGLGANPEFYESYIRGFASAGYVVVAPRFPLTNDQHPGGPDAGDTANQPGDVSFLIDVATGQTDLDTGILDGLVDPDTVGTFGHSNGGITTFGVAANSCCADPRIDAAIVLAGTPTVFRGGEYDWADAPPMLIIHATGDPLVAYSGAQSAFNSLDGPKGLLTIDSPSHTTWLSDTAPTFDSFFALSLDFFDAYLLDDQAALARLAAPTLADGLTFAFTAERGTGMTVVTEPPLTGRTASADPTTGLTNGQTVTVTWSGFSPGKVVNVVQCSNGGSGGSDICDLTNGKILQPDPTGEGSLQLEIIVGAVGVGTCDATTDDCVIVVNDGGLQEPDATIRIPLTFAG